MKKIDDSGRVQINFRVPADVEKKLQHLVIYAASERRKRLSMTQMIIELIERASEEVRSAEHADKRLGKTMKEWVEEMARVGFQPFRSSEDAE